MKLVLVLIFSLLSTSVLADDRTYWDGIKTSATYMYKGSYMQFMTETNLYYAAAAIPSLWYSFEEDKRISKNAMQKPVRKYMKISSDMAPFLSFPIIPFAFYTYGTSKDNDKAVQFATETMGALYLALVESAILSAIDIHDRPSDKGLSKWETNFRENSSFPSGHVVPYAVFAFKTLQFYGPYWAILPSALFVATSIQRVRDGKHYLSDVVGGFFLSAFASEGVRKAANYEGNSTAYKLIFEHNLNIGCLEYQGVIGPKVSFDW